MSDSDLPRGPSAAKRAANLSLLKANILHLPHDHPMLEDDFELGKILGEGAFGVARIARRRADDRLFACKSIPKSRLKNEKEIDDISSEIRILKDVDGHENIVRFVGAYEDLHSVHLILELCQGGELFDRIIAKGSYSEKEAATLTRTMLRVLNHCHERNIIHRDIKPENFLFDTPEEDARLKMTDFGLSAQYTAGEVLDARVGTPFYVAPEVINGAYNYKADIFSVGCILYILLSGRPPFYGETDVDILRETLKGEYDLETDPWPSISAEAKEVLGLMLNMDPAQRPEAFELLKHAWVKEDGVASALPLADTVVARMKKFSNMNKLKKKALVVMAKNTTQQDLDELMKVFNQIDADKSGQLSFSEMSEAFRKIGKNMTDKDLEEIIKAYDVDGDGKISINEFIAATINTKKLNTRENLLKAFNEFDKDGNGRLTTDEVVEALQGSGMNTQGILDLIKQIDTDGNGEIDYEEFVQLMMDDQSQDAGPGTLFAAFEVAK